VKSQNGLGASGLSLCPPTRRKPIVLQVIRRVQAGGRPDVRARRKCTNIGCGIGTLVWERMRLLLSQYSYRYHSWCVYFEHTPWSLSYLYSATGVGAIYLALHLLMWFFADKLHFKGFQSGQYGSPPSLSYWARQAAVYVVSLTSMKLLVVLLLASWNKLLDFGAWLLSWLGNGDTAQVVLCVFFPHQIFFRSGDGVLHRLLTVALNQ
jgi:hypothetical protein